MSLTDEKFSGITEKKTITNQIGEKKESNPRGVPGSARKVPETSLG